MKTYLKQFQVHSTVSFNYKKVINNRNKPPVTIFYGDSRSFQNKITSLIKLLSEKETEKMNKFLFQEDKICYLVVHALLKKQLTENLKPQVQNIDINFFNKEKPFIDGINLDFNISHSGHLFSFIIADHYKLRVGVDIERVKVVEEIKSIAANYLSEAENTYIFRPENDVSEQLYRFYEVWTAKEAFLKMIGIGLFTDLSKISVTPGKNIFNLELPENYEVNYPQAFIYSIRFNDFIISVSLSEDSYPIFQNIIV
jgi:4'-phosphopantetheinyl transferase